MKNRLLGSLFVVAVIGFLASSAWAGGLYNYEVGSADTGLATAGYASRAQDASTLFTNPAGMTRLEKSEVSVAAQVYYLHTKFSPNSNTSQSNLTMPDGSAAARGNPSAIIPAGGFFFVDKISDKVAAGIGLVGFFGAPVQVEDNSSMRYFFQKYIIQGITFMPAIAYKVSDKISLGAGLNAMYSTYDSKFAINNRTILNPSAPDGTFEVEDNEWAFGGKFGILYEPQKGTRIGFTYLSKTKMEFSDTPTLTNVTRPLVSVLANHEFNITLKAPQQLILSAYHELTDKLAIMGDVGWENWQAFGQVNFDVTDSAVSTEANTHYQNTWHVALGTQYKLTDPWTISGGVAYDSSMMDGAARTPNAPIGMTIRYGAGAQYAMSQTLTLSGGYEYIWTGNLPLDVSRGPLAGRVAGEYTNECLQVFTLLLNWKM